MSRVDGEGGERERRGEERYEEIYTDNMRYVGLGRGRGAFWLNVCLLFTEVEQNLCGHEYS